MTSEKPDWFKMNPAQFLQDGIVDAMTALELGAAFRLLCRQWIDGDLVDDKALLARQARLTEDEMERAWPLLSQFFRPIENGRRANRYMWVERQAVAAKCESKSDAFRALARKRWDNAKKADDEPSEDDLEGNPKRNAKRNATRMPGAIQEKSREEQSRGDATLLPPSEASIPIAVIDVVETWNNVTAGKLPRSRVTPKREKEIRTRLKEVGWLDDFKTACDFIARSPFHLGQNDRNWIASLDFLLRAGKATELAEQSSQLKNGNGTFTPQAAYPVGFFDDEVSHASN